METPEQPEAANPPSRSAALFQTDKPAAEDPNLAGVAATESNPVEPKKKKYYSPNEVMKKKGCIGCGGMALALFALSALAIALMLI